MANTKNTLTLWNDGAYAEDRTLVVSCSAMSSESIVGAPRLYTVVAGPPQLLESLGRRVTCVLARLHLFRSNTIGALSLDANEYHLKPRLYSELRA